MRIVIGVFPALGTERAEARDVAPRPWTVEWVTLHDTHRESVVFASAQSFAADRKRIEKGDKYIYFDCPVATSAAISA